MKMTYKKHDSGCLILTFSKKVDEEHICIVKIMYRPTIDKNNRVTVERVALVDNYNPKWIRDQANQWLNGVQGKEVIDELFGEYDEKN